MKNNQKGFANAVLIIEVVILALVAGYFVVVKKSQQSNIQRVSTISDLETRVKVAIEKVLRDGKLTSPNEQMPKGIKLLSVKVVENNITLDFSKEYMSKGAGMAEDIFSLVSNVIHPIIQGTGKDVKYLQLGFTILVEGEKI